MGIVVGFIVEFTGNDDGKDLLLQKRALGKMMC